MLTFCLLGMVVGFLMGLTGAGGGILAVPLLVFFTGVPVTTAAPIALTAVAAAASIGALAGLRKNVLRYRAACVMSVVGIAMAPLGLWVAHQLDNRLLMLVFAILLLVVAAENLAQRKWQASVARQACLLDLSTGKLRWTSRCSLSLMAAGGLAGFLSGLVGVGGGFVVVPALGRLSNLSIQSVIPTSLAVIALVSLSSLGSALLWERVDLWLTLPFVGGAMLGMMGGRQLTQCLTLTSLKRSFAVVAAAVAVMMLLRAMA